MGNLNYYKIKITGSGTVEELKRALQDVITSLDNPDNDFETGEQFEDAILYAEVYINDDADEN
jgi:hypothetical protein